ncbi:toxin-antitoxin system TumE family protein [Candidatus Bipolaricaulota sp. J31]
MDTLEVYKRQLEVAKRDFSDIVEHAQILFSESGVPLKLRLSIVDGSIVDCFWSPSGKYSYHWDRRAIDGTVYRHDNAPHGRWAHVRTFPERFHDGSEDEKDIRESTISDDPIAAIREFLTFVRNRLVAMGRKR